MNQMSPEEKSGMNTDTGDIYRTLEEKRLAMMREEPLVEVSERVADAVEIGMEALNRAERRAIRFPRNERRERDGMAMAPRTDR